MWQQRPRRRYSGEELFLAYLATGCTAAVVGVVTGLVGLGVLSALKVGCHPARGDVLREGELHCPDGTAQVLPALVLVGLGCLVVVAAAAALISRRADASTIARVSRHAMWLAIVAVAIPGLALTFIGFGIVGAAAIVATAFVAIPFITSYVWPARTTAVLAACLAVPVAVLLLGWWLPLLVPSVLPLAGIWLVALWLWRMSRTA